MDKGNLVIIDCNLVTTNSTITKAVQYQFDYGVVFRLENAPDCPLLIEFCNLGDKKIQHDEPFTGADIEIPRDLLQDGRDVQIFVSVNETDYFKTLFEIDLRVIRRPTR